MPRMRLLSITSVALAVVALIAAGVCACATVTAGYGSPVFPSLVPAGVNIIETKEQYETQLFAREVGRAAAAVAVAVALAAVVAFTLFLRAARRTSSAVRHDTEGSGPPAGGLTSAGAEEHGALRARVTTHWFNGWFLRLFARPYLVVDGVEHAVRWGRATDVPVSAGSVRIGAGVRYAGRGALLGAESTPVDARAREGDVLVLRNGFWNHTPFRIIS